MNASVVYLLCVLSADPVGGHSQATNLPDSPFAAVIRGQSPSPYYPGVVYSNPPVFGQPGEIISNYQPGTIQDPGVIGPVQPGFGTPYDTSPYYNDPYAAQPGPYFGPSYGFGAFYTGFDFVFVKPHFSSDAAFQKERIGSPLTIADPNGVLTTTVTPASVPQFDWDMQASPRFWIGFAGPADGLGFQVRYWQFDHGVEMSATGDADFDYTVRFTPTSAASFSPLVASDPLSIVARHDLELHALDAEGTWHSFSSPNGSVTVTGGLRYVRMDQSYRAKTSTPASSPGSPDPIVDYFAFDEFLRVDHDFEGFGPTISVNGRRRITNSPFALFANLRFAAVYGSAKVNARRSSISSVSDANNDGDLEEADGDTVAVSEDQFIKDSNGDLIPITELQAGVEWSQPLWMFGGSKFFLRIGVEGQVWFDAGTGLNSADVYGDFSPQIGNLGFLGFMAGGGLSF
jgi:hypothetical protein